MRSMATLRPTSRCGWRRPPAAIRASWRRPSRAALPANDADRAHRGRRRRLHQFLSARQPRARRELARIHELGAALRPQPGRRRRARAASSSCPPIRPVRCTSATAARPPTARRWPTSWRATGFDVAARVLHQRCRPADGHPRRQHLDPLSGAMWRERCRSRSNGYRGDYVRPLGAAAAGTAQASGCARPRPQRAWRACRRTRPQGDKEMHIDALIARCRELIGAGGLPRRAGPVAAK